jgi:hypothetical protein
VHRPASTEMNSVGVRLFAPSPSTEYWGRQRAEDQGFSDLLRQTESVTNLTRSRWWFKVLAS